MGKEEKPYYLQEDMFSRSTELKSLALIYGGAFIFVILGLLPWAIGMAMLTKWFIFS